MNQALGKSIVWKTPIAIYRMLICLKETSSEEKEARIIDVFQTFCTQGRADTSYTGVGGRKTKIFRRKNHQQQQQQQQLYRSNSAVTKIWPHFVIQR